MMKNWLYLIFSFLFLSNLSAQKLEKFSDDKNAFMKELEDFMTASKNSSMKDAFEEFAKNVKSGVFTPEELGRIQRTGDLMLGQRMTANSHFKPYLVGLNMVKKESELGTVRFQEWHDVLHSLLGAIENRRFKPFDQFLRFSSGFFERNTLKYNKVGVNWIVNASRYEMIFEDGQAKININELDLIAVRKQDSIVIQKTSGYYLPKEEKWYGKGGTVTWARYGLGNEVNATLADYEIEIKKGIYNAKDVQMRYPLFFGQRVVSGSFSDKLMANTGGTKGSYPRFESNEGVLDIKNIGEGINVKAGFRLQGTTVYGFRTEEQPASIEVFNKNNEKVFDGESDLLTIKREELIVGERVKAVVTIENDSIFHPSVNMRFDIPNQEMQLTRGKRGSDRNPFFSSLHVVNIDAEKLEYKIASDSLLIDPRKPGFAKSATPTVFESLQYFSETDYNRLQNIATTNPIALMKVAYLEIGDRFLDANYLAQKLNPKFSVENINSLLYDLVSKGFINYDADKKIVELKDKVFHYADASQKKIDYDILRINSKSKETNAVFQMSDKTITINGVSNLEFSLTQRVGVKPYGDVVKLKKNRDLDFDGKIFAGFSLIQGKDFHFGYESFDVTLDSCRYFDFFIPTGEVDKKKEPIAYSIGSRIEHLNGVLLIDAPSNKSGKEEIDIFPSMQSKEESYVYYDYKGTQNGAYKRDSFYFELTPFSFNSLDNYTTDDLNFKGKLFSADIFPVFDETLLIREDTSLGFVTSTPAEGYPNYQGKGDYTGTIDLSNKGLLGEGTLNYLGAVINSEDLIFRPKQLTGSAENFDLEEDRSSEVEVPQVRGYDVKIDWRPYQDSMYVRSKEAPFELFKEDNHTLKGMLILTPGGLKAQGLFDWDKASMSSKLFSFGAFSASADTTNLKIKAFNADALALTTENLNGLVDFDEQIGKFKANAEFLTTTLPYNQYETSFNEFDWDMKEETVNFKVKEGKLGSFLSIHPDQDSLRFQGKTALYDLKTNLLQIGGVPYIVTSDAFVYTETGDVEIQPGAVMTELTNAKIVADTINQYHVINRANVKILGKKEYRASGYYEYNIADKEQEIKFEEIIGTRVKKGKSSEKASVTRANGEIASDADFYIDHKTKFTGTIKLEADKPNLFYDGFARMESETLPVNHWFSVNCEADKNDLKIEYNKPLNPEGERLHVGLFLSKETATTYPRVLSPLFFRKDRPILEVTGIMDYDDKRDQFIFGDSLRMLGGSSVLTGNQLIYDNKTAAINLDGKFNLGSGLKHISIDAAGTAKTEFGEIVTDTLMGTAAMSSKTTIETMLGAKLIVPEELYKIMVTDFKSSSFDANPVAYAKDADFYRRAVSNIFPENKDVRNARDGIVIGSLNLPKKHNPYSFLFGKSEMKWDSDYQSFVSSKEKLPLMSINGEMLNMNVEAYIEAKMPTNEDDRLYIYVKSPSQMYYFFGYKQGIMNITSNNTRFMEELNGLKDKDRVYKMGDGEPYEIQVVEPTSANAFVNRAKSAGQ